MSNLDKSNSKGQSSSSTTTRTTSYNKLNELNKSINLRLNGQSPSNGKPKNCISKNDCEKIIIDNTYNNKNNIPKSFPKSNQFPLYFGTDASEFCKNREITRNNRKMRREILLQRYEDGKTGKERKQDQPIERSTDSLLEVNTERSKATIEIDLKADIIPQNTTTTNLHEKTENSKSETTNTTTTATTENLTETVFNNTSGIGKPQLKWSAVVQKAITSSTPKPKTIINSNYISTNLTSKSSVIENTSTPSKIEPLGSVLLKIMYAKDYASNISLQTQPCGLLNTGNICYMNAILQLLLHCEPFHRVLKLIDERARVIWGGKETLLIGATLRFFALFKQAKMQSNPEKNRTLNNNFNDDDDDNDKENERWEKTNTNNNNNTNHNHSNSNSDEKVGSERSDQMNTNLNSKEFAKPLNPEKFYHEITKLSKFSHLKWGQQEDAEEFLGYFLDGLHEEFLTVLMKIGTAEFAKIVQEADEQEARMYKYCLSCVRKHQTNDDISEEQEEEAEGEEDGWLEVGGNKKVAAKRTVEVKPSPITRLFGGQFRSVLNIPKSKEKKEQQSITLDPFQHIQLDISDPKISSLEDAFKVLSEPEFISYTASGNAVVTAKKQIFIDKFPKIFIVHLKRFSYTNGAIPSNNNSTYRNSNGNTSPGRIEKLKNFIKYSHNLNIPLECISTPTKKLIQSKQEANNFKLVGVVYHHGVSTSNGHYTCDVKSSQTGWVRIDDTVVEKINEEDVINGGESGSDNNKTAYILMYEKIE